MSRFQVETAKKWVNTNGQTASIYGAVPYTSEEDKKNWKIIDVGYTIRDNKTNTVGIGKQPFQSIYDVALIVTNLNILESQNKPAVIDMNWLKG